MLSPELLAEVKRIELKARRSITAVWQGAYTSRFRGMGMEFDEVRAYQPGDDIRTIDWNVTARMREPFVKVFREEREMTLMLLVDVSASMRFGTRRRFKVELAAELAAVLAFLAIRSHDRVGLIVFSDHTETFIPPGKGRAHVWKVITSILAHEGRGTGTSLARAVETLRRHSRRRSLVFLITDAMDPEAESALTRLASAHDVVLARVVDPVETQGTLTLGAVTWRDLESGETWSGMMDGSHARAAAAKGKESSLWRRLGLETFTLTTEGSTVAPLIAFLRQGRRVSLR